MKYLLVLLMINFYRKIALITSQLLSFKPAVKVLSTIQLINSIIVYVSFHFQPIY